METYAFGLKKIPVKCSASCVNQVWQSFYSVKDEEEFSLNLKQMLSITHRTFPFLKNRKWHIVAFEIQLSGVIHYNILQRERNGE